MADKTIYIHRKEYQGYLGDEAGVGYTSHTILVNQTQTAHIVVVLDIMWNLQHV
jgi:hypothetical protein